MILSVDVYSSKGSTKAVHVVPFPSLPNFVLTDANLFNKIQWWMEERIGYKSTIPKFHTLFYEQYLDAPDAGIDIISHEIIGPHDITVLEVSTSYEFRSWANNYFKIHGLENVELPENTREVIDFYLLKGYPYFVFDIIDVNETQRAVDQLAYSFESSIPYFPLKISSLLTGYAIIDLAFITPENVAFDYKCLNDQGFNCESTNLWKKTSMEYFNKTIADKFDGDTILEHYLGENIDLESIDSDIELKLINDCWIKTETDYIYKPIKGDLDQNGLKDIMYFNGEGIVLLDPYSGDKIWFIDTQGYPNYNDITYIDFNSDGIDDQVLYKTYKSWEDDYRKVSYLICFSNNNLWIYNRSIKLDISPYSILEEVLVKNSTIILKFYRQVFGVEILLNEVIWKVDLGVPIYSFDLINIDKDPKYEIVICPDNKIFGMDILSLDIPTKSNTSVTLGPFTYNDGLTPIIYGSVYLENEDGLVLVSETDKNRELSINIHPDTYQCIL